jgi:hypothetical protein
MKKNLSILILLFLGVNGFSQSVYVPYGEYAFRYIADPHLVVLGTPNACNQNCRIYVEISGLSYNQTHMNFGAYTNFLDTIFGYISVNAPINSLQLLKKSDTAYSSHVVRISEPVIENLMIDLAIDEKKAADIFYTSKTFAMLADKNTEFYKKDWTEIYKLLRNELAS